MIKILKNISKDDIIPNCKGYQKVAQNYFLKGESNYGFWRFPNCGRNRYPRTSSNFVGSGADVVISAEGADADDAIAAISETMTKEGLA